LQLRLLLLLLPLLPLLLLLAVTGRTQALLHVHQRPEQTPAPGVLVAMMAVVLQLCQLLPVFALSLG
jgi:hypothetical protein